jgi:hypothetical protein
MGSLICIACYASILDQGWVEGGLNAAMPSVGKSYTGYSTLYALTRRNVNPLGMVFLCRGACENSSPLKGMEDRHADRRRFPD